MAPRLARTTDNSSEDAGLDQPHSTYPETGKELSNNFSLTSPASIGLSLSLCRRLAGLTLEQVAEAADTTVRYLARVETGEMVPTRSWIRRVTAAISASLSEEAR